MLNLPSGNINEVIFFGNELKEFVLPFVVYFLLFLYFTDFTHQGNQINIINHLLINIMISRSKKINTFFLLR